MTITSSLPAPCGRWGTGRYTDGVGRESGSVFTGMTSIPPLGYLLGITFTSPLPKTFAPAFAFAFALELVVPMAWDPEG